MARITSRQAQEMMDAYAKVYENKEETAVETSVNEKPVEDIQERILRPSERAAQSAQTGANFKKATAGYKFSGSMQPGGNLRVDPVAKPQPTAQPVAKPQPTAQPVARPQPTAQPVARPGAGVGAAGGRAAGAVGGGQPAGGARAIGQKVGGAIGGGIDRGVNRVKGGLGRLGALAGRAVGAAGKAAGAVRTAARSAAGNIASGAKRVAGGVADAATGNMTDFDKRGGKPQGVARVVAGGIDKLTGDRTDLDKRGVSKLNAGQRAQQQQKQQAPQQEKPAPQQEKPAPQQAQQPVKKMGQTERQNRARLGDEKVDALKAKNAEFQAAKKSGNLAQYRKDNPKLSGRERAQQMARERIAAKKAAPAKPVQRKVTSVMDMEGYDPMENLFDDTVQFLVSEGHAKDVSEAMSIMSESEFIDAFNQEING